MPFEILAKKGGAGEIQGVGNLLDGHVCGFQFGFDVHHHYMGNDVQYVFSGHLFHGGAEVLQGKLLIIPGLMMRVGVAASKLVPEKLLSRILYHVQAAKQPEHK